MSNKAKKRVDNRPALSQNLVDGFLDCQLCNQKKRWKGGSFTRHLQSVHQLTTSAYYIQIYGNNWKSCLCGCGEETAWESREGYYKGYISGHNYRGKTKETDLTVALRTTKMIQNEKWLESTFKKGQKAWNKCSTDVEYLQKLFKRTKLSLKTSGIKKGKYESQKSGILFYYDSGWELERMKFYDAEPSISSWSRCDDLIPYIDTNGQKRHYNPDFIIKYGEGKIRIEEIKGGRFGESTHCKLQAANEYYKNIGYEYIVITKRQDSFIQVPLDLFLQKKEV